MRAALLNLLWAQFSTGRELFALAHSREYERVRCLVMSLSAHTEAKFVENHDASYGPSHASFEVTVFGREISATERCENNRQQS
jgi:hypothetical protein